MSRKERAKRIIVTSIIGIVANILLALFKAIIGFVSHSVSITMDALNNITDATSSIVTIVGTKLAGKQPDKKHPFGHGRVEYISALIIGGLVLYAGVTALIESIKKIIEPQEPEYSMVSLIIIIVAVLVKIVLGLYVKSVGKKVNSNALIGSGKDALLDAVISAGTVVAAILYVTTDIYIESYLAGVISIVIIKSGFDMLKETISQILGERNDIELDKEIKKTVTDFEGVKGACDLVLNNYGPNSHIGSIHVEVPDTYSAVEIDILLRKIQAKVYEKHGVILTAIGIYSYNTSDDESMEIRKMVTEIASKNKYVNGIHGFYYNKEEKTVRFDMIISFDAKDRRKEFEDISKEIVDALPEYKFYINMDTDFSEL